MSVVTTVCLFDCPKLVECAFFEILCITIKCATITMFEVFKVRDKYAAILT